MRIAHPERCTCTKVLRVSLNPPPCLACNNLVLDDTTVVVPSDEALNPIADALKARKFEVIRIRYRVPCMAGGSFRCHQPLIRN